MARIARGAAVATLVVLIVGSPARAQEYPPAAATCGLSATVVPPGGSLTVSCSGFLPGSPYTIEFLSPEVLSTGTVSADGTIRDTVTIPSDASPGDHIIRVTGIDENGQPVQIDMHLTVVAPGVVPGLAVTGGNITTGLLILVGFLLAGAAALLVGRRRARVQA